MPPETYFWNDNAGCVGEVIDTTPKTRDNSNNSISKVMQRLTTHVRRYKQTQLCISTLSSSTPAPPPPPPPPLFNTPKKPIHFLNTDSNTPGVLSNPESTSTPINKHQQRQKQTTKGKQHPLKTAYTAPQPPPSAAFRDLFDEDEDEDIQKAINASLQDAQSTQTPNQNRDIILLNLLKQVQTNQEFEMLADIILRYTEFVNITVKWANETAQLPNFKHTLPKHIKYAGFCNLRPVILEEGELLRKQSEELTQKVTMYDSNKTYKISDLCSKYYQHTIRCESKFELMSKMDDFFRFEGVHFHVEKFTCNQDSTLKDTCILQKLRTPINMTERMNEGDWSDFPLDEPMLYYFQMNPMLYNHTQEVKIVSIESNPDNVSQLVNYLDIERFSTIKDGLNKWVLVSFICRTVHTTDTVTASSHYVTYMSAFHTKDTDPFKESWYLIDDLKGNPYKLIDNQYELAQCRPKDNRHRGGHVNQLRPEETENHIPVLLFYIRSDILTKQPRANEFTKIIYEDTLLKLELAQEDNTFRSTTLEDAKKLRLPFIPKNETSNRCWLVSLMACLGRTGNVMALRVLTDPDLIQTYAEKLNPNHDKYTTNDVNDAADILITLARNLIESSRDAVLQ